MYSPLPSLPLTETDLLLTLDFLVNSAVSYLYSDNLNQYNTMMATESSNSNVNYSSPEMKEAISNLARCLDISCKHVDKGLLLEEIAHFVAEKLSPEGLEKWTHANPDYNHSKERPVNEKNFDLGFETGANVVDNAARVLRILYVQDLREVQTHVNELISRLQDLTADPKTNASLGKVGK
eukprot:GCRY01001637.1.p1 GENE.GCRY01001637.1~~GCRY01001637.1.p1  ORF type:complete len:180 (-),score=33.03 GCRY01001637.1:34-573(-)